MSRDTLIVDGRAYSWKQLCELRRAQRDASAAPLPRNQPCSSCMMTAAPPPSAPPLDATASQACSTGYASNSPATGLPCAAPHREAVTPVLPPLIDHYHSFLSIPLNRHRRRPHDVAPCCIGRTQRAARALRERN